MHSTKAIKPTQAKTKHMQVMPMNTNKTSSFNLDIKAGLAPNNTGAALGEQLISGVRDYERVMRLRRIMVEARIDYLILRLPENILYATGYWPLFGASFAVVGLEWDGVIFFMDGEQPFVVHSWVEDVRPYSFLQLEQFINLDEEFALLVGALWAEKALNPTCTIGIEGNIGVVAANNIGAEVRIPGPTWSRLIQAQIPNGKMVDATGVLSSARTIKSKLEIDNIHRSSTLAGMGYQAVRGQLAPGLKDAEIAAIVESTIYGQGVGFEGLRRVRGFCSVLSGSRSSMKENPYFISSDRCVDDGDLVLIELLTCAEGYFSDLTRTITVGDPSKEIRELWNIVHEALESMLKTIAPGALAADVFRAGKAVIDRFGRGTSFIHNPGHGIGLQFHEPPTIHPLSQEILAQGMTLALEPHLYIPGWGGIRLEQNIAVTADGFELLSEHPIHL